jgi:hypothetical protein
VYEQGIGDKDFLQNLEGGLILKSLFKWGPFFSQDIQRSSNPAESKNKTTIEVSKF